MLGVLAGTIVIPSSIARAGDANARSLQTSGGAMCGFTTFMPQADTTGRAAPYGRIGHSAILDTANRRLVIFGGDGTEDSAGVQQVRTKNDGWTLPVDAAPSWSELLPNGNPPPRRRAHTAVYDAPRERMIVFGGISFDAVRQAIWPDDSAMVWSLELGATPEWSLLPVSPALPPRRFAHAAVYDPTRQHMWVHGGSEQIGSLSFSADLYYLELTGTPFWMGVTGAGAPPPGLAEHIMVYDSARDRLLIFGGIRAGSGLPNRDVWAISLTGTPTWTQLETIGTPPDVTTDIDAVYDPVGDQVLVIGPTGVQGLVLESVPTWRAVRPHATRYAPAAVYDPVGTRVFAMGGEGAGGDFNDVIVMTPPPTVRWSVTPADSGSVVVDYQGDCPEMATLTAVPDHGYEFSAWSGDVSGSVNPITLALGAQLNVVAHFVTSTATLISRFEATRTPSGVELRWSFGDPSRVRSTSIDRRGIGEPAWHPVALEMRSEWDSEVAMDRDASAAIEYEYRLRVMLGTEEEIVVGPIRAAATGQSLWTTIESVSPNPSRSRMTIGFALAHDGPAQLTVLDVAGREVTRIVQGVQSRGRYQVSWDGTTAGRPLPAGLYFARLAAEGRSIVRKLVLAQ